MVMPAMATMARMPRGCLVMRSMHMVTVMAVVLRVAWFALRGSLSLMHWLSPCLTDRLSCDQKVLEILSPIRFRLWFGLRKPP
jgi:hypothetical protein